eukprot:scaffold173502_cov31-Tisochrysis_lutea.AAC.1
MRISFIQLLSRLLDGPSERVFRRAQCLPTVEAWPVASRNPLSPTASNHATAEGDRPPFPIFVVTQRGDPPDWLARLLVLECEPLAEKRGELGTHKLDLEGLCLARDTRRVGSERGSGTPKGLCLLRRVICIARCLGPPPQEPDHLDVGNRWRHPPSAGFPPLTSL